MESKKAVSSLLLTVVYRVLIACAAVMGILILWGTIYVLLFREPPLPRQRLTRQPYVVEEILTGQPFLGIGQLRLPTADAEPKTLILVVSFMYYPDDRAFAEELVLRVPDFRTVIAEYVASLSATDLQSKNEDTVKAELLKRMNSILRLGQIEALYFSDFMVL